MEAYPPHLPKARSSVNVEDALEEQKKWHFKDCEYGDYVSLLLQRGCLETDSLVAFRILACQRTPI